ncbi:MAG: DnaD domain protein [Clostridiales bacterium]|nr:DnaD domain protein [Clostridiales bacterium]
MTKKESFVVYNAIEEQTSIMTDEQAGQLFRAMLRFSKGGEPEISDPLVALAFSFVRPTMERDRRKYEEVCSKRQEAGRKGGRPRKQQQPAEGGDFLTENQMVSEKPDNVNVNVYENDYDYVREEVYVYVSVLDSQDAPDTQSVPALDGQTEDCDTCERDVEDVLTYAGKAGYRFTSKQRKRLRQWCSVFPFEVVILAFDRSIYFGGRSVTYVYRILQEWQEKGLCDLDAVEAYLADREGGSMAQAI